MEESALVFHDKIAPVRGKEMRDKLNRMNLKLGAVWLHKEVTACVVTISELKNDQVYYKFSRNGGLGILKTDEFLEAFEPARNKLLEPGATIWHQRDDYDKKVTITNFDGDTVSYQYPGDGCSVMCGRANIESFLIEFIREYPEYDRIPVGSIWKAIRGCSEELKGKLIKVVRFTGSIISWMCIEDGYNADADVTGTSRSSFLYCFDKVKDNDNDALYGFRDTPGNVIKVIKTKVISSTKDSFRGSIEFFAPMKNYEKSYIQGLIDFHTVYKLISLDPVEEYTVPADSVNHLTVNPEEDDIKPNQIWVNKIKFRGQPMRYVKVEKPVHDNIVHWIDIGRGDEISWTNINAFLKYYEKIADNDEGYDYVDRRNCDRVVKVLPYKYSGTVCYKIKSNDQDLTEDVRKFHEIYEPWGLAKLRRNNMENNEAEERTISVPNDEETKMEDESLLIEGTWWKNKKTGEIGFITDIQKKKGLVIFRFFQTGNVGSFTNMEFLREFRIAPSHPENASFDTKSNKDESIMENSKETYLKTDVSKLKAFEGGAKREDKKGKGRYDLIPGEVINSVKEYAWNTYFKKGSVSCSKDDVDDSAYFDDWMNEEKYLEFITNVIVYFYIPDELRKPCIDDDCHDAYFTNWEGFTKGLIIMRKALAGHYEVGAEVHGIDNWKKGLPVYGSARGGCFLDSMRRHSDQALMGLTDEPHAIAAIWNAVCAIWTLRHKSKSAIYQNASAVKAEDMMQKSAHFDMIDAALDALKHMPENKIEE